MSDHPIDPVPLIEDETTGDRFLIHQTGTGPRLNIRYDGDAFWMTQAQIGELFGRDVSVISRHIRNVLEEGELDEKSSLQKLQTTPGRPATLYSLDMVISVGYRVSSAQATLFRRWATGVLVQFAKAGFVVDKIRLKEPENADRVKELREIIRDIRSDEANLFRELQQICTLCQDYDPHSNMAHQFFQRTQAKLVYAVVSQTPSEIVADRADHSRPNMGLKTWPKDNVRKADVTVSKNYLTETEIKELNRLTTILLDIFEDQLDVGRLVVIKDAERLLHDQLKQLGRSVLSSGGSIDRKSADRHAHNEYDRFQTLERNKRHQQADAALNALAKEAKSLPRSPKKR